MIDEALRTELLELAGADQDFRRRWPSLSQDEIEVELGREHARSARLAELIDAHGWPGRSRVGDDGARAAWLLAQHADHDRAVQERCLALLESAVAAEDAAPRNLAYLTDRVRVAQDRPQLYGTQFCGMGGELGRLDERRAAVGLGPFAEYEARLRELNASR
jgi:hypothetical protein